MILYWSLQENSCFSCAADESAAAGGFLPTRSLIRKPLSSRRIVLLVLLANLRLVPIFLFIVFSLFYEAAAARRVSLYTHANHWRKEESAHLKWRRLNNIFFSGLQKGGSQSVALLRLPGSCQCEGCQQALLSTRPQTIYRIKMVPSAFNTSAWACCSCCKCVWAFPASTVTSAPPCVSCSSWK